MTKSQPLGIFVVKVKFCGIWEVESVKILNELCPDFVGFVFADSKRKVSLEVAKKIREKLNPSIKSVGVFVNATLAEIIESAQFLNAIQLHGDENLEFIKEVKVATKLPIIKSVSLENLSDKNKIAALESKVDFLLFDGKNAGSGEVFNWNLLKNLTLKKPYFLAGGLNAKNLKNALKLAPFCVDISSGIEIDGHKNETKMREILEIIRTKK